MYSAKSIAHSLIHLPRCLLSAEGKWRWGDAIAHSPAFIPTLILRIESGTSRSLVNDWMYRELNYREGYDIQARFDKTKYKTKIAQIEAEGFLPQLHAICNHFLGT